MIDLGSPRAEQLCRIPQVAPFQLEKERARVPLLRRGDRRESTAMSRYQQSPRRLEWVVKVSKLCNLRCEYCYEYNSLSKKEHIAQDQLKLFFTNAKRFGEIINAGTQEFIWHGGEPMILPVSYYESAFAIQTQIFGQSGQKVINRLQTNLFVLRPEWLKFLASKAFTSIGVSFDIMGDLRIDSRGATSELRVVGNMDKLRMAGIPFGVLVVLSKRNLEAMERVFDFCAELGCSFRVLPIYREAVGRPNTDLILPKRK